MTVRFDREPVKWGNGEVKPLIEIDGWTTVPRVGDKVFFEPFFCSGTISAVWWCMPDYVRVVVEEDSTLQSADDWPSRGYCP